MAANRPGSASDGNQGEIVQSIRRLLHMVTSAMGHQTTNSGVTSQTAGEQRQGSQSSSGGGGAERPSVQMEMTRSFPGMFAQGRGKRRFPKAQCIPAKKMKPLEVVFHLLPKQYDRSPNEEEQVVHLQAGLGRRTVHLDESTTHDELCETLNVLFPKLATVTGGWLVYKCRGGWGSRKLSLVAPDDTGYTGKILKMANKSGSTTMFIAPIQEELNTDPLHPTDPAFSSMPKATCQKCTEAIPLQLLTEHIKSCAVGDGCDSNLTSVDASEPVVNESLQQCPLCTQSFSTDYIAVHASSCGESAGNEGLLEGTVSEEEQTAVPGPSGTSSTVSDGWLTISDPIKAMSACASYFRRIHEVESPLLLSMDLRQSPAEQDLALISFYKRPNVEWARPLTCRLEGDTAVGQGVTRFLISTVMQKLKSGFFINFENSNITRLFEGAPGHLVPSASHFLVESDMFLVAGRMIGHSFIHEGPCLSGLSPAVVHVLLGGSPETATVTMEDCPDLDIKDTIKLLERGTELSDAERASVQELAYAWDLPSPTESNQKWLFEKLLIHAVIGRVTRQIKQMRRGLKETPVWMVLTKRPETVALIFPREGTDGICPEIFLQSISWPREEEDEDDDWSVETKTRILGYLREFIENGTAVELMNLAKFWTGWEILPKSLSVEIVRSSYPTASTCYETLKVPGHYNDYTSFRNDLLACIGTCQTGFGLL